MISVILVTLSTSPALRMECHLVHLVILAPVESHCDKITMLIKRMSRYVMLLCCIVQNIGSGRNLQWIATQNIDRLAALHSISVMIKVVGRLVMNCYNLFFYHQCVV